VAARRQGHPGATGLTYTLDKAQAADSGGRITPAGIETVIAGMPGAVGVRAATPGSLGPINAITAAPDGTVHVMSENALVRILQ